MYNSILHHLYIVLRVHHPKSCFFSSPFIRLLLSPAFSLPHFSSGNDPAVVCLWGPAQHGTLPSLAHHRYHFRLPLHSQLPGWWSGWRWPDWGTKPQASCFFTQPPLSIGASGGGAWDVHRPASPVNRSDQVTGFSSYSSGPLGFGSYKLMKWFSGVLPDLQFPGNTHPPRIPLHFPELPKFCVPENSISPQKSPAFSCHPQFLTFLFFPCR